MPKYIEMGLTDVVHESDLFGAFMPPKEKQDDESEEVTSDENPDSG